MADRQLLLCRAGRRVLQTGIIIFPDFRKAVVPQIAGVLTLRRRSVAATEPFSASATVRHFRKHTVGSSAKNWAWSPNTPDVSCDRTSGACADTYRSFPVLSMMHVTEVPLPGTHAINGEILCRDCYNFKQRLYLAHVTSAEVRHPAAARFTLH